MDAWLKANAPSRPVKGKGPAPTSTLNYSRFDKIVDSDDEEDEKRARRRSASSRSAPSPRAGPDLSAMPPEVRNAYAKVAMAQQKGDMPMYRNAMVELEAQLQVLPADFREKLLPQTPSSKTKAMSEKLEGLPPSPDRDALDAQLRAVEAAQGKLEGLDVSNMPEFLASVGLTADDMAQAERSDDPAAAMRALAERAVQATMVGGASAPMHVADSATALANTEEVERARRQLEEQQKKVAEAAAALEAQRAAVEAAKVRTDKAQGALREAERQKEEQGRVVDASVEGAKADMLTQAKKDAVRHALFDPRASPDDEP